MDDVIQSITGFHVLYMAQYWHHVTITSAKKHYMSILWNIIIHKL